MTLDAPVQEGLDRVQTLAQGSGFVNLSLGAKDDPNSGLTGFARGEAGWHFAPNGELFGFGEGDLDANGPSFQAGVGLRLTW